MKNRANEDIFKNSYEVYLELTNRCNLSCAYCYAHLGGRVYNGKFVPPKDLDINKLKEMLLDLKENMEGPWFIDIAGGEPTLYPHLIELLRFIGKEIGVPTSLYTNGTLVTKEMAREFADIQKTDDFTVLISIDSFTPQINNTYRGKTDNTLSSVEILYNAGVGMELSFTPVQPDFRESFEKAKKYGIQKIRVNSLRPSATGEFDYVKYRQYLNEDVLNAMRDAANEIGVSVLLPKSVETCNAGLKRIAVYADGSVSTCYILRNNIIGNINERKLSDIISDAIEANKLLAVGRSPICLHEYVEKGKRLKE
ncbi:MAG: radical SAM/SPASM domain-containing protein [Candidatus Micrarchaeia archaeon]